MDIKGKIVTLRAVEKEDLSLLQKWANDPEIQYQLGGWHFPTSMEDQIKWYSNLSVQSLNQRFAIDTPEHGLIGLASLVDINWKDKNAFHGMMLGDKDVRGKGYGLDASMAIMRYGFDELGLQRIDGSIIEYHEHSKHVYINKLNWKEEGRQRNWYYRKGRFWDRIVVGVTREDYYELIGRNDYWNK